MKHVRLICRSLGQTFLVVALVSTMLVKSAVGGALVLHQHGIRHAHLHLLSYGDLLSNAAFSPLFGHSSRPGLAGGAEGRGVRVLTIVSIGSVFVSTPGRISEESTELDLLPHDLQFCVEFSRVMPVAVALTLHGPAQLNRSAVAVLMLRNHTLLV